MLTIFTSFYHRAALHFSPAKGVLSTTDVPVMNKPADKPVYPTCIYVDMDNVIGQLSHPRVARETARRFDWLLLTMAKQYAGPVDVFCYGNLSYHGVKARTWQHEQCRVRYIDTPVVDKETLTDTEMVVEMLSNTSEAARTVLVSCDVDFQPVASRCYASGHPFDVIKFGPIQYKMLKFANQCLNGKNLLDQSGILSRDIAKEVIQAFLAEQEDGASLSIIATLLSDYKGTCWQGDGSVARFIESLNIPNLVVSHQDKQVYLSGVAWKLGAMNSPVLSHEQYVLLFKVLSAHSGRMNFEQLIQSVSRQCVNQGSPIDGALITEVAKKVLPAMGNKSGASKLARHYLNWLYRKSTLVKNVYLSTQDRCQLAQLVLC